MRRLIMFVRFVSGMASGAAHAQTGNPIDEKQCADQFEAADLNKDGMLSKNEVGNFKQSLPTSLADKNEMTRVEFIAVCGKRAS